MVEHYYKSLKENERKNIVIRLSKTLDTEEFKIRAVLEKMNPLIQYRNYKVITYRATLDRIKKELIKLG